MKIIRFNSKKLEKIYNCRFATPKRVQEKVRQIIDDVRQFGDDAVLKYTRKFDKVKLNPRQLKVAAIEISGAYQSISPDFVSTLKVVIENVNRFYRKNLKKSWRTKGEDGLVLGENYHPLERVGIYIPAGTAPLVSTVYMTVLPARIAGVKKIALISPPNASGQINPHILVVANLLKVDEIYRCGGAQGIAALAYGTKSIPKVDKIVGPGNMYVSEAKRQVFGAVDIDMLAGPTELAVIANRFSNLGYIKADLMAQAEHSGGLAVLITTFKAHARQLRDELGFGYAILVKNMEQAAEVANAIAPEHLEILVNNPVRILKKVKHAGAIFLGPYSPAAVGDYVAGPSHILPTMGTAKFFSGLRIDDFSKSTHVISYSKRALDRYKAPLETVAKLEGLVKHLESVKVRFS